ncbi:MAG TPA: hypothetical protein PKD76_09195 [Solirubrobacterales bacterium]|nr:hypothetical protein [Solirubrobacterales bacterium]
MDLPLAGGSIGKPGAGALAREFSFEPVARELHPHFLLNRNNSLEFSHIHFLLNRNNSLEFSHIHFLLNSNAHPFMQ